MHVVLKHDVLSFNNYLPARVLPDNVVKSVWGTSCKRFFSTKNLFFNPSDIRRQAYQDVPENHRPSLYGPYSSIKDSSPLIDVTEKKVHIIRDMKVYESLIYNKAYLLSCLFIAQCSTASQLMIPKFSAIANTYHQKINSTLNNDSIQTGESIPHLFLQVDVDDCPRAAYHANIDDIPTFIIKYGDDAFNKKIAPKQRCIYDYMITQLEEILKSFDQMPLHTIHELPSNNSWYDHNIRRDNLNIHRIGWSER